MPGTRDIAISRNILFTRKIYIVRDLLKAIDTVILKYRLFQVQELVLKLLEVSTAKNNLM